MESHGFSRACDPPIPCILLTTWLISNDLINFSPSIESNTCQEDVSHCQISNDHGNTPGNPDVSYDYVNHALKIP